MSSSLLLSSQFSLPPKVITDKERPLDREVHEEMSAATTAFLQAWAPIRLVVDHKNIVKTGITLPSSSSLSFSCSCTKERGGLTGTGLYYFPLYFHSKGKLPINCSLNQEASSGDNLSQPESDQNKGWWSKWRASPAEMRSRLAKFGLAGVLAYGLCDGITFITFFVLAVLGFEKSAGKNPAANFQALLGAFIFMWIGKNLTRPLRVAGAAALAPLFDKGLKKIQKYFSLPDLSSAYALVVYTLAAMCFVVVGLLIVLS